MTDINEALPDIGEPDLTPIHTYKLPYDLCDKFRAVNSRTESLTQLDVRLGLEQIMDDPQYIVTADLRGQRTIPEYVKVLARYAHDVATLGQSDAVLDFEGATVPEEINQILQDITPDQEPLF